MYECDFKSTEEKKWKIKEFLEKHGEDLPPEAIEEATTRLLDNFALRCNAKNDIICGATYKNTDWYLCAVKYLATLPKYRGRGLGTDVTKEVLEKTKKDPTCLVLTSDITYDNKPSKEIFHKFGFDEVNRFCWGEGEKPADILQMVRFPAKNGKCVWKEE